jgi:hypothetical protein
LRPSTIWHPWSKEPRFTVSGKVWWIISGMGFCAVLCRGDMLPENFHWYGHIWNACLPFSKQSNKTALQNH